MIAIWSIFVLTYGVTFYSAFKGRYNLRGCVVIFLILSCVFGTAFIEIIPGLPKINIAVFWYSAAISIHILLSEIEDYKFALRTVTLTIAWLLFMELTIYLLYCVPRSMFATREDYVSLFNPDYYISAQKFLAQICSFTFTAAIGSLMIRYKRNSYKFSYFFLTTFACQFVSSLIYYAMILFDRADILNFFITGLVLKTLLGSLFYPLIYIIRANKELRQA